MTPEQIQAYEVANAKRTERAPSGRKMSSTLPSTSTASAAHTAAQAVGYLGNDASRGVLDAMRGLNGSASAAYTAAQAVDYLGNDVSRGALDAMRGLNALDPWQQTMQQEEHKRLMDQAALIESLVGKASTPFGSASAAYTAAQAVDYLGYDVSRGALDAMRGLNALDPWQQTMQQEEHKRLMDQAALIESLMGKFSTPFGSASAAYTAAHDVDGYLKVEQSISAVKHAVAYHGASFQAGWLSAHSGGVAEYVEQLKPIVYPLADIWESIGVADKALLKDFDQVARSATYLKASGVAADRLLSLAMTPEGRKESPSWIVERFIQHERSEGLHREIAFPLVPVLPRVKREEERNGHLKKALRKERRRRKEAEDEAERAKEDAERAKDEAKCAKEEAEQSKESVRRLTAILEMVLTRIPSLVPVVEQQGALLAVTTTAVVEVTESEAPGTVASINQPTPKQRQAAQEEAVINMLKAKKYDPTKLPKNPPGKSGVKAEIRAAVSCNEGLFAGSTVFDKTWERLRASGEIQDVAK
jgi:hypothetical protein